VGSPLVIPGFIIGSLGFNVSETSKLLLLALTALCVAINEEVIFRGAIVKGFLRFGTMATLIAPAVLFGLIHLGNIMGGGDVLFTVFQAAWAIAGGIALTALRLRNLIIEKPGDRTSPGFHHN